MEPAPRIAMDGSEVLSVGMANILRPRDVLSLLTYISAQRNHSLMHALDVLGDPVRRRILELLAEGELSAGEIGDVDPARVRHLAARRLAAPAGAARSRVRDAFAAEGTRRLYAVDPGPLAAADAWFDPFRRFWLPHLDALGTELARGRRARRRGGRADETGCRVREPRSPQPTDDPEEN